MYTNEDKEEFAKRGLTEENINKQIENFKNGFEPLPILRAASIGDGILSLSENDIKKYIKYYDSHKDAITIEKFVPASGAATRMFKELFAFINEDARTEGINTFIHNIKKFAFYNELKRLCSTSDDDKKIVTTILKDGLNYGVLPKGLITFHKYGRSTRKAIEEHLVEAALYGCSNGVARIHFTVSLEHIGMFKDFLTKKIGKYKKAFGIRYEISLSTQLPSTDTIAVDENNQPFRKKDGTILFRPAGHGALIKNLNAIEADLIFIKTIDNVTTDSRRQDTITYKKALAGLLLKIQKQCFKHIKDLKAGKSVNMQEIADFIEKQLFIKLPSNYDKQLLFEILDRPIRICGMVKNEGEPGGGPFWVKNNTYKGIESLQIAESSQIAPDKIHIMKDATHFNPVDIVLSTKRYNGDKYDLEQYIDYNTGFITNKTSDGKPLKAQELPGLWNGSMANWNTIFVDVPITTFSPVKVVQDLLRPQHQ